MKYSKALMILFLAATLVGTIIFTSNDAMAKVGDHAQAVCSVCHTMHHSQGGTDPDMGFGGGDQSTGPNSALLYSTNSDNNNTCVACHTMAVTLEASKGYDAATGAPQVDLLAGEILAGGTYGSWSTVADDGYVHNMLGLCDPDNTLPAGSGGDSDVPPGGSNDDIGNAAQITCAGTTGCHGNRAESDNIKAVHGAHHTNDDTFCTGSSIGNSYRFLSTDVVGSVFNTNPTTGSGVDGGEETYWESYIKNVSSNITAADATEHNVYDATDINLVCASCHGNFHGSGQGPGPGDPWLRHPTDVTLASASASGPTDEYNSYPMGGGSYNTEAPVGFDEDELEGVAVAKTQGQVLCISCHRAHGSEYPDILRWCYSDMKATGGTGTVDTGCNRCHTTK